MKKIFTVLAAAAVLACNPTVQTQEKVLDGQSFNVIELNGSEYENQNAEVPASISFEADTCHATVGGNQIFAVYEEGAQNALSFSESGMTKMFVPEEFREDEFAEAFNKVASFKLEDGVLSLMDADGKVVIVAEVAAPAVEPDEEPEASAAE